MGQMEERLCLLCTDAISHFAFTARREDGDDAQMVQLSVGQAEQVANTIPPSPISKGMVQCDLFYCASQPQLQGESTLQTDDDGCDVGRGGKDFLQKCCLSFAAGRFAAKKSPPLIGNPLQK